MMTIKVTKSAILPREPKLLKEAEHNRIAARPVYLVVLCMTLKCLNKPNDHGVNAECADQSSQL